MEDGKLTACCQHHKTCPHIRSVLLVQFRFADPLDALLIFLGTVGAVGIGAALPGHMLLFGTILDNMINYELLSTELVPGLLYAQQNCTPLTSAFEPGQAGHFCNPTVSDSSTMPIDNPVNPLEATVAGLSNALFGTPSALPANYTDNLGVLVFSLQSKNQSLLMNCSSDMRADIISADRQSGSMSFMQPLDDAFFEVMTYYSLIYLAIAVLTLLLGYAQSSFWNTAAYRQGFRIRQRFFASLMYQDISWYDTIKSGTLPTRLAE